MTTLIFSVALVKNFGMSLYSMTVLEDPHLDYCFGQRLWDKLFIMFSEFLDYHHCFYLRLWDKFLLIFNEYFGQFSSYFCFYLKHWDKVLIFTEFYFDYLHLHCSFCQSLTLLMFREFFLDFYLCYHWDIFFSTIGKDSSREWFDYK